MQSTGPVPAGGTSLSDELFRVALEAASTGMLHTDRAGAIVLVNAQIERLFGYRRDDLSGMTLEQLMPERHRERHVQVREGFFSDPKIRPMGDGREFFGLHSNGTEIPLEIGLTPVTTSEGMFVLASIVDITERRHAMESLRQRTSDLTASLRERDLLLQEVHHRVKNNLQVISSLINLQARKLPAGESRQALAECRRRVEAIGLIHETLYQAHTYAEVPFSDYVRHLAANLVQAADGGEMQLHCDCDPGVLPVAKAICCGLMLSELMNRAIKSNPAELRVELRQLADGRAQLSVATNSTGSPPDPAADSLGSQLVTMLADQLHGTVRIEPGEPTHVTVTFPATD
ncbi:MAG TPA: histidine kinase dimerization/phosphoacceptor domain -containing protein [Povalibacter sp.]